MVEKFDAYLSALPTTDVIKKRIDKILKLHLRLADDEILDIMISGTEDYDGLKLDDSLWLFTEKFFFDYRSFLTEINIETIPYVKCIRQTELQAENYDFKNAQRDSFETYASSVKIRAYLQDSISCKFIATEENCSHALEIYKKYILPNLT